MDGRADKALSCGSGNINPAVQVLILVQSINIASQVVPSALVTIKVALMVRFILHSVNIHVQLSSSTEFLLFLIQQN